MTAFVIRRRTSSILDRSAIVSCANGCMSVSGGYREADVYAVFLDAYRVPLCRGCARAWRAAWESARPVIEPEAVAA